MGQRASGRAPIKGPRVNLWTRVSRELYTVLCLELSITNISGGLWKLAFRKLLVFIQRRCAARARALKELAWIRDDAAELERAASAIFSTPRAFPWCTRNFLEPGPFLLCLAAYFVFVLLRSISFARARAELASCAFIFILECDSCLPAALFFLALVSALVMKMVLGWFLCGCIRFCSLKDITVVFSCLRVSMIFP